MPAERRAAPADAWLAVMQPSAPASHRPLAVGGELAFHVRPLPGGTAPFTYSRGPLAAAFDGLIFEREELCRDLGVEPEEFPDDAQLILEAYLAWGDSTPARIKGIFTLAIFDGRRGRLLAARDRVGIHPLFYRERTGSLALAATIEAFDRLGDERITVDPGVIAGILDRHHPELEQTFHEGVRRVPPGSMLLAEAGSTRVVRYWRPPPVGEGADWVDESELGEFGRLLNQAVGRAMGTGTAGLFLSGGLDSVSVAAAAVEHAAANGLQPPRALSLLFPDDVREEDVQRGVAGQLGMPLTTMELLDLVGEKGLVRSALDFARISAAPPQNVWLPAYDRLAMAGKEQGCRTILTGGGGDEWLTVTPLLAADLIGRLDFDSLLRFGAALQRSFRLPTLPLWRNLLWTNGLKPLMGATYRDVRAHLLPAPLTASRERQVARRLERIPGWLAPDRKLRERLEHEISARARSRLGRSSRPGPGGYYFAQMENSLQHPLFAIDVEEIFESGRRWGMRQFDVYWDADLIEFLYRVPPHLLNRGGRSKGLVREDLARRFPGLGFDRQKKLLSRNYFAESLFEQSAAAWRELGGAPALADIGVIEPRGLDAWVSRVIETRDPRHIDDLWRVLSLESWVRPRV